MPIVECGMCQDLCNLPIWKESDIFICKVCCNILSEIRQNEIKLKKSGIKPLKSFSLALFDMKREMIRRENHE